MVKTYDQTLSASLSILVIPCVLALGLGMKSMYIKREAMTRRYHMKAGKIITWIGLTAMTVGLLNGFINGDFLADGSKLLSTHGALCP